MTRPDKAKELAEKLGLDLERDVYIGTDGFVRTSASDTISANQATEDDMSRGSSGGCSQSPDAVPDKG